MRPPDYLICPPVCPEVKRPIHGLYNILSKTGSRSGGTAGQPVANRPTTADTTRDGRAGAVQTRRIAARGRKVGGPPRAVRASAARDPHPVPTISRPQQSCSSATFSRIVTSEPPNQRDDTITIALSYPSAGGSVGAPTGPRQGPCQGAASLRPTLRPRLVPGVTQGRTQGFTGGPPVSAGWQLADTALRTGRASGRFAAEFSPVRSWPNARLKRPIVQVSVTKILLLKSPVGGG